MTSSKGGTSDKIKRSTLHALLLSVTVGRALAGLGQNDLYHSITASLDPWA